MRGIQLLKFSTTWEPLFNVFRHSMVFTVLKTTSGKTLLLKSGSLLLKSDTGEDTGN